MIAHFLYMKRNPENELSKNYWIRGAISFVRKKHEVYLDSYLHFLTFPCSLYLTISINAIPRFRFHTYYIQSFIFSTLLYSTVVIATFPTSRMHTCITKRVQKCTLYTSTYLPPRRQWTYFFTWQPREYPQKGLSYSLAFIHAAGRLMPWATVMTLNFSDRKSTRTGTGYEKRAEKTYRSAWCTVQRIKEVAALFLHEFQICSTR